MLGIEKTINVIDRTLLRFVIVGIGNTALGLFVIFVSRQFFSDLIANLVGYLVVVPVSFFTHRELSFRDSGNWMLTFVFYLATIVVAYFVNFAVLIKCLEGGVNPYLAQTSAIASHVIFTYIMFRVIVFRSPLVGR